MDDSVGLAKQTGAGRGGLGTPNPVPSYYLPVTAASPGPNTQEMELAETTGTPFESDPERGVQWFGPTMRGGARSASLPRLLSMFLGDPTSALAAGGTTATEHVHDPVAEPHPRAHSILMAREDVDPAIVDLLEDCIGSELALDVAPSEEGWVLFDATMVALGLDDSLPAPSATHDLSPRFPFYRTACYISVDGGAEAEIAVGRFGMRYSLNPPTDQTVLNSRRLYKAPPGRRRVELTFVPKEDLDGYYRRAMALEPESIAVRLVAEGPIIEAAIRHSFQLEIFRAFEFTAPADIDGSRPLVDVEVTARASLDAATNKILEATTTNAVAGPY